jgi:hypothetical protein
LSTPNDFVSGSFSDAHDIHNPTMSETTATMRKVLSRFFASARTRTFRGASGSVTSGGAGLITVLLTITPSIVPTPNLIPTLAFTPTPSGRGQG